MSAIAIVAGMVLGAILISAMVVLAAAWLGSSRNPDPLIDTVHHDDHNHEDASK